MGGGRGREGDYMEQFTHTLAKGKWSISTYLYLSDKIGLLRYREVDRDIQTLFLVKAKIATNLKVSEKGLPFF